MNKLFNKAVWKRIKEKGLKLNKKLIIFTIISTILAGSGAVLINNYFGAGEKTLSPYLGLREKSILTPSWGEPIFNSATNVTWKDESEVEVALGDSKNGSTLSWWVAARQKALLGEFAYKADIEAGTQADYITLMATEPVVENQIFNTYEDARDTTIGDYKGSYNSINGTPIYANNFVTSSVRAYFSRNQGGFPGTYSTRTGKIDGTAGSTLSDFESQYFTQALIDKIEVYQDGDTNATMSSSYHQYTERYLIPAVHWSMGAGKLNYTQLTWNRNWGDKDAVSEQYKGYMIPKNYLPANKDIWLRSPGYSENKASYANRTTIAEANVSEHKGYLPVMTVDTSDVKYVSQVRGKDTQDDKLGVVEQISSNGSDKISSKGPYHLKFDGSEDQIRLNPASTVLSNSKLKIPYTSYVSDAYVVLYLANKVSGATHYSAMKIKNNENGIAEFDMSNVEAGDYHAQAWIEHTEDGLEYASEPASFTVFRGHDVLFKEAEEVKFLDQNGDEIKESTVVSSGTGDDGNYKISATKNALPYKFIVQVDGSYDKSILQANYSVMNINSSTPLKALGAYDVNPGKNPNAKPVDQGDNDTLKTYWVYELSAEQTTSKNMQIKITTDGLLLNNYTVDLAEMYKSSPYETVIDGLAQNNNGKYSHGSYVQFGLKLGPAYEDGNSNITVKAINKNWLGNNYVDKENKYDASTGHIYIKVGDSYRVANVNEQNGSGPFYKLEQGIKDIYKKQYEALAPLSLGSDGKYIFQDIKSDTLVWIESLAKSKYTVSFASEDKAINLETAADIFVNDGSETKTSVSGIEYGSSLGFKVQLKTGYNIKGESLTAVYKSEKTGKEEVLKPLAGTKDTFKLNQVLSKGTISIGGMVAQKTNINFAQIPYGVKIKTELAGAEQEYNSESTEAKADSNYGNIYKFKIYFDEGHYKSYDDITASDILLKVKENEGYQNIATSDGNKKYTSKVTSISNGADSYAEVTVGMLNQGTGSDIILEGIQEFNLDISIKLKPDHVSVNNYDVKFDTPSMFLKIYYATQMYTENATSGKPMRLNDVGANKGNYEKASIGGKEYYKYVGNGKGQYTLISDESATTKYLASYEKGSELVMQDLSVKTNVMHGDNKYFYLENTAGGEGSLDSAYVKTDGNSELSRVPGSSNIFVLQKVKADTEVIVSLGDEVYAKFIPDDTDVKLIDAINLYGSVNGGEEKDMTKYLSSFAGVSLPRNSQFKFRIEMKGSQAYSQVNESKIQMIYDQKIMEKDADGYWTFGDLQLNVGVDINVKGIDLNRYNITVPTTEGFAYKVNGSAVTGKVQNVKHGIDKVEIKVTPQSGYKIDLTDKSDYVFSVDNPADATFHESHEGQTSNITSITLNLSALKNNIKLDVDGSVAKLNAFQVRIVIPEEAAMSVRPVSVSGEELEKVPGEPEGTYEATVIYGKKLLFKFASEDGSYDLNDLIVRETLNEENTQVMIPAAGVYTTQEVRNKIEINVETGQYNSYLVTFAMDDNSIKLSNAVSVYERQNNSVSENAPDITTSGAQVRHGKSLELKIGTKGKYNKSSPIAKVIKNGVEVNLRQEYDSAGDYYYFILDAVTEKTEVIISEVTVNKYEVMFSGDNVHFYNDDNNKLDEIGTIVEHGKSFPFTISAEVGYDISTVKIKIKDYAGNSDDTSGATISAINESAGRYQVNGVTNDITVSVEDIKEKKYKVKFQERGDLMYNGDKKFKVTAKRGTGSDSTEINVEDDSINVNYAEKVTVYIELLEKYDKSNISLKLSDDALGKIDEISSDLQGQFEYSMYVMDDVHVYVENLGINNHSLNFSQLDKSAEIYDATQNTLLDLSKDINIQYGKPYSFRLKAAEGYNLETAAGRVIASDGVYYDETNEKLVPTESGGYYKYTLSSVKRDTDIEIGKLDKLKHSLKLDGSNVEYYNEDGQNKLDSDTISNLEYGSDYTFVIKASDGYNLNSMTSESVKTNNGTEIREESTGDLKSKKFVVKNIKADTTVIINDVKPNEYAVKFGSADISNVSEALTIFDDSGNDVTLGGISTHKNNFRFKINLKEAYNSSIIKAKLKVYENVGEGKGDYNLSDGWFTDVGAGNGEYSLRYKDINEVDGYYIIEGDDIQRNTEVSIEGISRNKYSMQFNGEGAIVKRNSGSYDDLYGFNGSGGYEMTDAGKALRIAHSNDTFTFRVYADSERGFKLDPNTVRVYVNNGTVEQTGANDSEGYYLYTLSNVTDQTTIYVEGLKSTFYKLRFIDAAGGTTGFNVKDEDKDITSGIYLPYGDSLEFSIHLKEGYDQSESAVELAFDDGTKLEPAPGGKYAFTQGDTARTIKVTGVKVNEYTVTLMEEAKVIYKSASGDTTLIPGKQEGVAIQHSVGQTDGKDEYTFQVHAQEGYVVKNAHIGVNNASVDVTDKNDDRITVKLTNLTSNVIVEVIDVGLNAYEVLFAAPDADSSQGGESRLGNITVTAYGTGRDITYGMNSYYGKEVKFKISLHEGYTMSKITSVEALNGRNERVSISGPDADGYYTIASMPESPVTITINGVTINTYNVILSPSSSDETASQVEFYDGESGAENEQPLDISKPIVRRHGESYNFRVKAKDGYVAQGITAVAYDADVELLYNSDKNWMVVKLSDIIGPDEDKDGINKKEVAVNISGIKKNKYTVKFGSEEGDTSINNVSILGDIYTEGNPDAATFKNITNSGQEIPYGSRLIFKIMPNTGYDRIFNRDPNNPIAKVLAKMGNKSLDWVVEQAAESFTEGYIITDPIIDNTSVMISGVAMNVYNIELAGNYVKFYNAVNSEIIESGAARHGGYFRFKVRPNVGYDLSNMGITSTVGELTEESKNNLEAIYTLSNITDDVKVNVRIDKAKVELGFEEGEGFKYQKEDAVTDIKGFQVVEYGTQYSFAVRVKDGYDPKSLKVYQGDSKLTPDEPKEGDQANCIRFTTTALVADTTIKASVNKMKYDIKFQAIEGLLYYENGVEVNNNSMIMAEYGDIFQFSVKLDGKHNQSALTVFSNGRELALINGVYTITDIAENINITVEGVEVNHYKVNLSKGMGVQYNVMSNGTTITQDSGVHVREYGGSISFSISPIEGYETTNMVVTVKSSDGTMKALESSGGVYTVSNITEDKTVIIAESSKTQYTVKLAQTTGITYMNDSGVIIHDFVKITHGNNFEFTISLNEAYDESVPVVVSTGKTGVTKLETGKYMISNVTEDITISVSNVVKNTYNVNLTGITGIYYKNTGGKTISGDQSVGYNEDFVFGVGLHSAYTDSKISVMIGSDTVKLEPDGFYRVKGILENKTVTVIGVEENVEVDLINTINGLPDTIRDAADVSAVVSATKGYNGLSEDKQANVTNISKLLGLQQQSGTFVHTTNDISVSGVDWNIKLVAVPLSSGTGEHERIYDQLGKEFILSLYDIYLWDMLADKKYDLPEGKKVVVTIPTPDLTYFENPLVVHEKSSDGKLEYLIMTRNGDKTSFEMTSFSPVGIAATKSLNTGYSSLYEEFGGGMDSIKDGIYDIMQTGVTNNGNGFKPGSGDGQKPSNNKEGLSQGAGGLTGNNIDEGFAQGNSNTKGSALRLLLVMILGFTITGIVTVMIRRNDNNGSAKKKKK